jgi:hypothetical protein
MVVALLSACQELEIDGYENDPRLYFYRATTTTGQRDSITYSFFFQGRTVVQDTVWVEVRTMGLPSPEPRPFKVMQSNASDTSAAKVGTHYLSFDSATELMQVPPGAFSAFVPVILLRDASLKQEEVRLEITITENEHFKLGVKDNNKFTVKVSDFAARPASWTIWEYFSFKTWGPQKMLFLIEYLGIDFNEPAPMEFDILLYYAGLAKDALKRYNDLHPLEPLREDDGTLVSFD